MPCMCGALDCWSCGPAQGTSYCYECSGYCARDHEREREGSGYEDLTPLQAESLVQYYVDTALSISSPAIPLGTLPDNTLLVGWWGVTEDGEEQPVFVAVLPTYTDPDFTDIELAIDVMQEFQWFKDPNETEPDFVWLKTGEGAYVGKDD